MKDFCGRKVEVGDYIFYSTTGRYPESRVGKITSFSKAGFPRILITKANRSVMCSDVPVIVKNDYVKIDSPEGEIMNE